MTDPIVEAVRAKLLHRSRLGIAKYGTTLERTDIGLRGWLRHSQEEAMDLACYLERIMAELPERPAAEVAWGLTPALPMTHAAVAPTTLHERVAAQSAGHVTCGHEGGE